MKLSVIVPIYNASAFIRRGLDSIVRQKIGGGYEIILVDDGSTDDTPIIVEEYEKKYDFIRAYKKSNGGVSSARNLGLQHANGEYITFFDIDDEVEDGYYQSLLAATVNGRYDIIVAGYKAIYDDRTITHQLVAEAVDKPNFAMRYFEFYSKGVLMSVWNKLFKKEVVQNIEFELNRKSAEDYLFCLEAYIGAQNICFVASTGYCYYKHNSNTSTQLENRYNEIYELSNSMAYRSKTTELYLKIGVSVEEIFNYHCKNDYIWFYRLASNVINPGNPYSKKEQTEKIREIMSQKEPRKCIMRGPMKNSLSIIIKILLILNSPVVVCKTIELLKKNRF